MIYNICMSRNLATQRENMCAISNHVNKTLILCYTVEAYRDNKFKYYEFIYKDILNSRRIYDQIKFENINKFR